MGVASTVIRESGSNANYIGLVGGLIQVNPEDDLCSDGIQRLTYLFLPQGTHRSAEFCLRWNQRGRTRKPLPVKG